MTSAPIILAGHEGEILDVAVAPDGRWVFTAANDRTVRQFDASSGETRAQLAHEAVVPALALSPDGLCLATVESGPRYVVTLWDTATAQKRHVLDAHTKWLLPPRFSIDGRLLLTASVDEQVLLWDVASGALVRRYTDDATRGEVVTSIDFSSDGRHIAATNGYGTVRVWPVERDADPIRLGPHGDTVHAARFSPDGSLVATASADGLVRLWETASGNQIAELSGHAGDVCAVSWSPDGRRLVSASYDQTARLWSAETGEAIAVLSGHTRPPRTGMFSADGRRIVTYAEPAAHRPDATVRVWDGRDGTPLAVLSGHDPAQSLSAVAWAPDSRRIVSASCDRMARIWPI